MKNVLVFPCGSEIGLEIGRSLEFSTHFSVVGGSSVSDHGEFSYEKYIGDIPFIDNPDFMSRINEIVEEHDISYIIPAHDDVVLALAEAYSNGKLKCEVLTSQYETCSVARSKSKTYELLRGVVECPKVYDLNEGVVDGRIFLKPDIGQGSKGTYLAQNYQEAKDHSLRHKGLIALEYLPGDEYTVDCFTDRNRELRYCGARTRSRIVNGISVRSESVENERFSVLANKINAALNFRGVWFFQVKERSNGDLVLMEIAPRVAGTMGLTRVKGINLALLSLFDREGGDIAIPDASRPVVIDRALSNSYKLDVSYQHVYVDFDDTVIVNGKVNSALMRFLFQALNDNKTLHLITRHTESIDSSLREYRLGEVFDEVIHLKSGEEKAHFIKEKDAIFIDDSFGERNDVAGTLGIPVFDPHAIEGLVR